MVKVGDQVEVLSDQVGQPNRRGLVTGQTGGLIKIKWSDGSETMFRPHAGSLRVVGKPPKKTSKRKAPPTSRSR